MVSPSLSPSLSLSPLSLSLSSLSPLSLPSLFSQFDIAQSELELYQEAFTTLKNQISEVKEQLSSMKTTGTDKEKCVHVLLYATSTLYMSCDLCVM